MKSVDEIERLSLEDLERISLDESIPVPEGLEDRVTIPVIKAKKTLIRRWIGIAASVVIIAGAGGFLLNRPKPLEDTFDDPMLAYAMVEKTLERMSDSIGVGMTSIAKSEEILRKPGEVIRSINMDNKDNE